jgi:hypothetical protein
MDHREIAVRVPVMNEVSRAGEGSQASHEMMP